MKPPPCWHKGQSPNICAQQLYQRTTHNLTPLYGHWTGWRMAGRVLVSPDGDRISPERLRGILWRESLGARHGKGKQTRHSMDNRNGHPACVVDIAIARHVAAAASGTIVQHADAGTPGHTPDADDNAKPTSGSSPSP